MADVTPIIPAGRQVIEAYGNGRFTISGEVREGSVIVLTEETLTWDVSAFGELSLESFHGLLAKGVPVDILLLGCGPRMALVPSDLRRALRAEGMVVEAMDTGAACRTYNILLAEERRVAAALIAVE